MDTCRQFVDTKVVHFSNQSLSFAEDRQFIRRNRMVLVKVELLRVHQRQLKSFLVDVDGILMRYLRVIIARADIQASEDISRVIRCRESPNSTMLLIQSPNPGTHWSLCNTSPVQNMIRSSLGCTLSEIMTTRRITSLAGC